MNFVLFCSQEPALALMLPRIRILYLTTLLFLYCIAGRAQSLRQDSIKVFAEIDQAEDYFGKNNYDSALFYCKKADDLSRRLNFRKGQAYAEIEATDIYIDMDSLPKAELAAALSSKIGQQLKDSLVIAISLLQMAQIKMYSDRNDEAITFFEKCLKQFPAAYTGKYLALAYNDFGFTWGKKGDLSKQADKLLQSVRIYETYLPDNYSEIAIAFSNLSTVYYNLNQKPKAIEYALKSIAIREKTGDIARLSISCCNVSQYYLGLNNGEAEKYLQRCIQYAQQLKQSERMVHAYVTASSFYSAIKQPEKAMDYEMKTIALLEKSGKASVMLARRYMAVAMLSRQLPKDAARVMEYFDKTLATIRQVPDKFTLRDYYQQLASYYHEIKNDSSAFDNYQKYILYRDSIISDNTRASIADIATKYETEKKDNQIRILQTDGKIRQLEIEKQKAVIQGNLLEAKQKENEILVLSQQKDLQDARLQQQSQELEKQMLLYKSNQQQLQLAEQEKLLREKEVATQKQLRNFIIAAAAGILVLAAFVFNRYKLKKKIEKQQELLSVRNVIARDLHDEIGSTLTSIKILSEVSKNNLQKNTDHSAALLSKITEQSEQMQQGMSDIVWAIKPDNDKLENMVVRMREYTSHVLEPKQIAVNFIVSENLQQENLTMQQRRDLFLIFKEAVNNAAKYSGASAVNIRLQNAGDRIRMSIEDNGRGFDSGSVRASNGLRNMRTRAEALGGHASIISTPGAGTSIDVDVPTT